MALKPFAQLPWASAKATWVRWFALSAFTPSQQLGKAKVRTTVLPRGQIAQATWHVQHPLRQALQQRRGRDDPHPGGGQLDGQRQPVEVTADVGHGGRVRVVADGEVGQSTAGSIDDPREAHHQQLPRGERIELGGQASLEEILFGPGRRADGTTNIIGALRRAMATTGYSDVKEFQRVEVVVSPYMGA